jgi:hypothetical protein
MVVEPVLRGRGIEDTMKHILLSMRWEQVISAWFSGVTVRCGTFEVYWRRRKLSTLVGSRGSLVNGKELVTLHEY